MRPLVRRVALVGMLLASVALIYAEKQERNWVQELRLFGLGVTAPIANAVASPVRAVEDLSQRWAQLWNVYSDNQQLRLDNQQLLHWREVALTLEAENAALRELMHYQPHEAAHYVSGKVVGQTGRALSKRMTINVGAQDGLRRHMPVVSGHGLVGRTLDIAPNVSEVLLLSDVRSRIPVVLRPSGMRALLIGDHGRLPYLKLADPKQAPRLGEVVMTSDDGGLLPEGLRVGKLFASQDDRFEVLPDYQAHRMDFVRVIDRQKIKP